MKHQGKLELKQRLLSLDCEPVGKDKEISGRDTFSFCNGIIGFEVRANILKLYPCTRLTQNRII